MTFEETFCFENLLKTHKRCRVGKAHKKEVIHFELNLGENLSKLSEEVNEGFKVSKYKKFMVYEPKKRVIEALPYRDRLVQMALCRNLIEPALEKRLIFDNCACRKGRGTHFAIFRLEKFLHSFFAKYKTGGYFLKVDISKYFASIDHQILKSKLQKCDFDERTLALMFSFIDSSNSESKVGIPLGNQTSQWFALLYLDEADRFIKEVCQIEYYIRYMDDLILIDKSKNKLKSTMLQLGTLCKEKLHLNLNSKTQIGRLCDGIDFLGFRHVLTKTGKVLRFLRKQSKQRYRKKIKFLKLLKSRQLVDEDYIKIRLNSFRSHLSYETSPFMPII